MYIKYILNSHEVRGVGLNMVMTRISNCLLITSTFLCGTQLFWGQNFTEQLNYVILVQTTLNNKETTDKKKWAETGITNFRRILNVRVSQVRVVSSELTVTLLVRLTCTNWARHVQIRIQILSLHATNTIFVIDNDVEILRVLCVVW